MNDKPLDRIITTCKQFKQATNVADAVWHLLLADIAKDAKLASEAMDDWDARMHAIMPLFQEARDTIAALTTMQAKLHGISPTLADRMDDVGVLERWKFRRLALAEARAALGEQDAKGGE